MRYDFCLDCGSLLAPYEYECETCGFDNRFNQYSKPFIDDEFINDFNNTFGQEEDYLQ